MQNHFKSTEYEKETKTRPQCNSLVNFSLVNNFKDTAQACHYVSVAFHSIT